MFKNKYRHKQTRSNKYLFGLLDCSAFVVCRVTDLLLAHNLCGAKLAASSRFQRRYSVNFGRSLIAQTEITEAIRRHRRRRQSNGGTSGDIRVNIALELDVLRVRINVDSRIVISQWLCPSDWCWSEISRKSCCQKRATETLQFGRNPLWMNIVRTNPIHHLHSSLILCHCHFNSRQIYCKQLLM